MNYEYQKSNRYFAQVTGSMEKLGMAELQELGATDVELSHRGIHFVADAITMYSINYQSRILTRILAPIVSFQCSDTDILYNTAKTIEWSDFLNTRQTFAIFSNVSNSKITHSQFAGYRLKDAIVDHFREKTGYRPNVDTDNPDLWINLHIMSDEATISIDASGGSLHKRGYRLNSVKAPLQETLAAAIIRETGWDGNKPLYDITCGSGTLLSEALMLYCEIPAGFLRERYGFEHLPDYNPSTWQMARKRINEKIRELPRRLIFGNDISLQALQATKKNLSRLPYSEAIRFTHQDFRNIKKIENATIVSNPPYGIRMEVDDLPKFYSDLGDFLKQKCTGCDAYIYVGDRNLIKYIGLKANEKIRLVNGALDGRLLKYEIY